ncbi:LOW QUALITY PROTEIN: serine/threonine kinase [Schistosoma mansoni]|uniref:serine/threonine kinase n=1 Tax=Schistosoma mansoni TaxID=6183 RepID=UPI00022C8401|nr:LOW QUALITY PROTEIN: serine/threonine kinase [Schistosoma mansoni]|eukprot:XP_018645714.1 LOW QUALITY PROTEIN: serine/threonine kinase [Schistosoma mansoni]
MRTFDKSHTLTKQPSSDSRFLHGGLALFNPTQLLDCYYYYLICTSIHLFNIHKSRLHYNLTTMKSSIYNPQYINLFKSWSDLSKTIDYPQLTKYISLPNIYLSEQISMYPNEMSKNDKSIQSISPRKVSFIKTIRQFISRSEQKKLLFKCVHIPVTEFTTFSDIFAFG